MLNIGVGLGELEELLIARGFDVYCLDPIPETTQAMRQKLRLGDKARIGYASHLPFDAETFDCVIMTEVIEHLREDETKQALAEVRRVLKTRGRFIGTVPADENLVESMVVCPRCSHRFHRWGHQQTLSATKLHQLLQQNFNSVSVKRVYLPEFSKLNLAGKIYCGLKIVASSIGIKGHGENLYFEALK